MDYGPRPRVLRGGKTNHEGVGAIDAFVGFVVIVIASHEVSHNALDGLVAFDTESGLRFEPVAQTFILVKNFFLHFA